MLCRIESLGENQTFNMLNPFFFVYNDARNRSGECVMPISMDVFLDRRLLLSLCREYFVIEILLNKFT